MLIISLPRSVLIAEWGNCPDDGNMRTNSATNGTPHATSMLLIAVLALAGLSIALLGASSREEAAKRGIVVVGGVEAPKFKSARLETTALAPLNPSIVSPELAAAHVRQAYPLLSNSSLSCADERCTLTGTVLPLYAQTDLDKRQEMLLGGLAFVLARDGYSLEVPFQFDEVTDNTFSLEAFVTRRDR